MHSVRVVDRAGFKARQSHQRLERGTRRKLRLNRAVEQRMVRIGQQLFPVRGLDAHGEFVGIEGGPVRHGEHVPIARIEGDNRAFAAFKHKLGDGLQIQVDGELDVLPRRGLLDPQDLALAAAVIHHHFALAVDAGQNVVVLLLNAEFADDRTRLVLGKFGCVQLALADFTRVADDVRGESVLRVEAPLGVNELELGEEIGVFVRFDERDVGGRQFLLDDDRFIFRPSLVALELQEQVVVVQIETFRNGL